MDLSLYSVTWNVHGRSPSESNVDWSSLLNVSEESPADIYAIGFQESSSWIEGFFSRGDDDEWTLAAGRALEPRGYVKLRTVRLIGIILSVFCLQHHLTYIRNRDAQSTMMGFWNMGSKGCVSQRMTLYGVTVCFINCHLTAHDYNLDTRVQEYHRIVREHTYNEREPKEIFSHNYVIWLGDLNFRLNSSNISHSQIVQKIQCNKLNELVEIDQLYNSMKTNTAFGELIESRLDFPPTYKFLDGQYALHRNPAWTDRILYRMNNSNLMDALDADIIQLNYLSHDHQSFYDVSDHLPVAGTFKIITFDKTKSEKNFGPFIKFRLSVEEDKQISKSAGHELRITYQVKSVTKLHLSQYDYIGLFKENFGSLDDYVTYCWALPLSQVGSTKSCTISKVHVPGNYVLLYLSRDKSVLGISKIFAIR